MVTFPSQFYHKSSISSIMNRISQAFFRTNFGAGKTGLKVGHKECLASSSLKPSNMPFWRGRLGGSVTSSSMTYAAVRQQGVRQISTTVHPPPTTIPSSSTSMSQDTTTLVEDVLLHPTGLSFASPESDFTMPHEDDWTSRVARFIEFEALVVLLAISGVILSRKKTDSEGKINDSVLDHDAVMCAMSCR